MTRHGIQPQLLRTEGTSLHRQVFLVLREQIARAKYAPGSALPTEAALCSQYNVSRITVRHALAELATEGYVERRQGRGTFVLERNSAELPSAQLTFEEAADKVALETSVDVLVLEKRTVPASIAASFDLPVGAKMLYTLRLRRGDDLPLMLTEAWLPTSFAATITIAKLRQRSLYQVLRAAGVRFGRVLQELSAESADPLRAKLLETAIGAPLLRVTRLIHDANDKPIQHLVAYVSPERSRVLMHIPAAAIDTLRTGYIAHDVAARMPAHFARRSRRKRKSTRTKGQ